MTRSMLRLAPILALLTSCSREAPPAAPPPTAPPATPTATATATPPATGASAPEALDRLDLRAAVPLLPMMANHQKEQMRDHLVVVQEIVAALATEDYPAIEKAAARIGSAAHPMGAMAAMGGPAGKPMGAMGKHMGHMGQMGKHLGQMAAMGTPGAGDQACVGMGAGAAGFTEQAFAFHRTADGIAAAARDRDRTRVLAELGTTMQACTACHAKWKQQVVDEPTWARLTASAPPSASAPPPADVAPAAQH